MAQAKVPWLIVGVGVLVAAIAALLLGPWFDGLARPDADGTIEVVVDRYRFEPAEIAIPSGEPVTLRFVNRNDFIYHLTFGHEQVETDGIPSGFEQDLFAGVSAEADPPAAWQPPTGEFDAVTVNLYEDSTSELLVTLPADRVGTWEAGCFVGRGCTAELQEALTVIVE
jgi:hypothetical protein